MKISLVWRKSRGFALLALLCCLVIILTVFASIMLWISSNGKQMQQNETFTSSEAAAEGGTEYIYANMDRDYIYQNLNSSNYYASLMPPTNTWPVLYTFSNSVILGEQVTNLNYLGSEYTNLLGFPQTNIITVTATPIGQTFNVPATVNQTFVFAAIPAFQFAIFYNINLEIDPGATMPIAGAVFSNGGIWSGTANVTYSNTVEAAGQVSTNSVDPFVSNGSKTDTGTPQSNFLYPGPPPQPESNVNPLIIPIGANSNGDANNSSNVEAIVNIPPASVCAPQSVAYLQTNQVYDFNAASLIISNWCWGSNGVAPWSNNFTVMLQDSAKTPNALPLHWNLLTNDYYIISNRTVSYQGLWPNNANPVPTNYVPNFQFTNNVSTICWTNTVAANGPVGTNYVWYAGFSFLTNATFYDQRESATVQAIQFDVRAFRAWITNSYANGGSNWNQWLCQDLGSHGINSAFIYNAVPLIGQQQLPAVRVVHGWHLPNNTNVINGNNVVTSGLTLVTPQPMYVMGNYNVQVDGSPLLLNSHDTANTYPSAFLADAITILSTNWSDANSSSAITSRVADTTTINAACLEGIVPSNTGNYSGGVENFLRLLQDWSSVKLTYNGSIMVMFDSEYATNLWPGTGKVYNPPTRDWSFDTNFLAQPYLPPLTPMFRAVIRNSWSGY
jgi:hypothetical protein